MSGSLLTAAIRLNLKVDPLRGEGVNPGGEGFIRRRISRDKEGKLSVLVYFLSVGVTTSFVVKLSDTLLSLHHKNLSKTVFLESPKIQLTEELTKDLVCFLILLCASSFNLGNTVIFGREIMP